MSVNLAVRNTTKTVLLLGAVTAIIACSDSAEDEPQAGFKPTSIQAGMPRFTVNVLNSLDVARSNELIYISAQALTQNEALSPSETTTPIGASSPTRAIAPRDSITSDDAIVVMFDGKVLKHQWVPSHDGSAELVLAVQSSFLPQQTQKLQIIKLNTGQAAAKASEQAYAELAVRVGGTLNDKGQFEGGEYLQMASFTLPTDHTVGNKLFKYEGFGWESDLIGYRYYFDNRGAIDVFGKATTDIVLPKVGLDGGDYHALDTWGMDVLKVGGSVGLGAVAALHSNDVIKLTDFDSARVNINNGALFATAEMQVQGWQVGEQKHDLTASYSIAGGSRLTKVSASTNQGLSSWATAIVNHSVTKISSPNATSSFEVARSEGYCYRATYGKQSLNKDNLGMAIFYPCAQVSDAINNDVNLGVAMQTAHLHYYFMAAWEAQSAQFASQQGFVEHLDSVLLRLNNPITVR